MKINRNNYEEYFLDYYEKGLDPGQVAELMVFLEANPDLNDEFESFDTIKVSPQDLRFQRKNILKKKNYTSAGVINAFNYEEYMVAGMENDLEGEEQDDLRLFLNLNPEARLEYDLFRKTRLVPDDVAFRDKESLKQKGIFLLYRREVGIALAIAASILVFLAFFLQSGDDKELPGLSRQDFNPGMESLDARMPLQNEFSEILPRSEYPVKEAVEAIDPVITRAELALLNVMPPLKINAVETGTPAGGLSMEVIAARDTHLESLEKSIHFPADKEERSLASRFVQGAFSSLLGGRERSKKSLLEYTVSGYNLMSDRDLEVEKQYDATGRIIAYQVNGELIKIGQKVNPPMGE